MRALDLNTQSRKRVLLCKRFQRPEIFENDLQLRAANHALPRQDKTGDRRGFHQPLQAIPAGLRNLPQLIACIQDKIDNHQWEIAIA